MDINFTPQSGFQERFLTSSADVVIGGGAAGSGKTMALLMEPLRYIAKYKIKGFSSTIFRRTYPEIENPGGLWDESMKIYPYFGGIPVKSAMEWYFKDRLNREYGKIVFRHFQREDDKINYQGAQLPMIGFDELTHFTKEQFFYLLSRNRGTCGIRPYVRATCNPDADSWVAEFIDWYIGDDGYIIKERDGVKRYFTVDKDRVIWGDTSDEVIEKAWYKFEGIDHEKKSDLVKSFSFIEGDIHENKILMRENPEYLANLLSLSEEDQLRLYRKNWKVKIEKNIIFNFSKFQDLVTNDFVVGGRTFITADIATTGRDLFVVFVWRGKILVDVSIMASNSGKEAIEKINELRVRWEVLNSDILFDADGVGGGMSGWITNCVEFHGGSRPIGGGRYSNLKSQCYFELSYCINQTHEKTSKDCYYILPEVASRVFEFSEPSIYKGRTLWWILNHQMKAIRMNSPDKEKPLSIINKAEQKVIINNISPDFMDVFMMRERFELLTNERFVIL